MRLRKIVSRTILSNMCLSRWFLFFLFSDLKTCNKNSLFSTTWICTITIKHSLRVHYKGLCSSQMFYNRNVGVWFLSPKYSFGSTNRSHSHPIIPTPTSNFRLSTEQTQSSFKMPNLLSLHTFQYLFLFF